jgi:hypothetical protein
MYTAVCLVVEWEEGEGFVYVVDWILLSVLLSSGKTDRGGFDCGFNIAGCVVVEWEEGQGLV